MNWIDRLEDYKLITVQLIAIFGMAFFIIFGIHTTLEKNKEEGNANNVYYCKYGCYMRGLYDAKYDNTTNYVPNNFGKYERDPRVEGSFGTQFCYQVCNNIKR